MWCLALLIGLVRSQTILFGVTRLAQLWALTISLMMSNAFDGLSVH